jgi:hypothetical protein
MPTASTSCAPTLTGRWGGRYLAPSLIERTHYGGAFLLLPAALALSGVAERTLARTLGSARKARRLVLSLFFRAALGIERIFHFETLDDLGLPPPLPAPNAPTC